MTVTLIKTRFFNIILQLGLLGMSFSNDSDLGFRGIVIEIISNILLHHTDNSELLFK